MKILALETSATATSVALWLNDTCHVLHQVTPQQQSEKVLPMIDELLKTHQIALAALDGLSFGQGPGSFTGVRIAASVIQGLAFALNLPVVPVSSLAALAQAAYETLGFKKSLIAIDARMQEIYWGQYIVNPAGLVELIDQEAVLKPKDIQFPADNNWYGVGNGWQIYRNQLNFEPLAFDFTSIPTAAAVIALALPKFAKKQWVTADSALPSYLRNQVASPKI